MAEDVEETEDGQSGLITRVLSSNSCRGIKYNNLIENSGTINILLREVS